MAIDRSLLRFCQAVADLSQGRGGPFHRTWWVTIDQVAERLGLDHDKAVLLAVQCAELNLLRHDMSQMVTPLRLSRGEAPHSVCLGPGWWLLGKSPKR